MNRVLITGINGFTGRHLAGYLAAMPFEIYGLDLGTGTNENAGGGLAAEQYYACDILDRERITAVIKEVKPDRIFHLAGLTEGNDLESFIRVNIIGTLNVINAINGLQTRLLIPGSAAEYGEVTAEALPIKESTPLNPVNDYGLSKAYQTLLGQTVHRTQDCQIYIARSFNLIGAGAPVRALCSSLARQIADVKNGRQEPVLKIGNLDAVRDLLDVRDACRAYWEIVEKGEAGEIYNVCSGKGRSIREIAEIGIGLAGVRADIIEDQDRRQKGNIMMSVGDNRKISTRTGWRPEIDLADSLKKMIDHFGARA